MQMLAQLHGPKTARTREQLKLDASDRVQTKYHTVKLGSFGMTGDSAASSACATPVRKAAETAAAAVLNFMMQTPVSKAVGSR